jgi:hypothetical protein
MRASTQTNVKLPAKAAAVGRAINSAVNIFDYAMRSAPADEISAIPDATLRLLHDSISILSHFVRSNLHDRRKAVTEEFLTRLELRLGNDAHCGAILRSVRAQLDSEIPVHN